MEGIMQTLLAASMSCGLAVIACSAGSGSPIDACSGGYTCTDGTTTVTTELEETNGVCTAGQLTLNPDGSVSGASNTTWSGDAAQFQICTEGDCLVCTPVSGQPSPPDAGMPAPDSSSPAQSQAIVATTARAATMGTNAGKECFAPQQLFDVPPSNVAPDTSNTSLLIVSGTEGVDITCRVLPTHDGSYSVTLIIEDSFSQSSLDVMGTFSPRSRDVNGVPNGDSSQIYGITMDYLDEFDDLRQTNCFAQYVLANANDGQPSGSLPDVADTYADATGGRIWVSVFCQDPQDLNTSAGEIWAGCQMSATFRIENCSSQ
jgi:hypothetical protein